MSRDATVHRDTPRPHEHGKVVVDDGGSEVLVDYLDELVAVPRGRLRSVSRLALEPDCTCAHGRAMHSLRAHPTLVFCDATGCPCLAYSPAGGVAA